MKLRWPMQQFQVIMYTNSLWTILSIISIVQRHILILHFVYWIILKKTILNLLDPSSTTSLVGKVIVCSLGEMSARGGLFTRGAKQVHMNNKNKKENQSTFQPCVKKTIQSREKYEEYPVTFQHRTNWQKCGEMTMTKLWLVLNYYLIGWQGHDSKLVIEGSKVHCNPGLLPILNLLTFRVTSI